MSGVRTFRDIDDLLAEADVKVSEEQRPDESGLGIVYAAKDELGNAVGIRLSVSDGDYQVDVLRSESEITNSMRPRSSVEPSVEVQTRDLVSKIDHRRVYQNSITDVKKEIRARIPSYSNLLNKIRMQESSPAKVREMKEQFLLEEEKAKRDDVSEPPPTSLDKVRISTLAIGWIPHLNQYVMFYNTEFILRAALKEYHSYNRSNYSSFEACYKYLLSFFLIHELEHVLRHHLANRDTELGDLDKSLVNRAGDAFINNNIAELCPDFGGKVRGAPHPTSGIIYDDIYSGAVPEGFVGSPLAEAGGVFLRELSSQTATRFGAGIPVGDDIILGKSGCLLKFNYSAHDFDDLFGDNSVLFVKFVDSVVNALVGEPERVKSTEESAPPPPDIFAGGEVAVDKSTGELVIVISGKPPDPDTLEQDVAIRKVSDLPKQIRDKVYAEVDKMLGRKKDESYSLLEFSPAPIGGGLKIDLPDDITATDTISNKRLNKVREQLDDDIIPPETVMEPPPSDDEDDEGLGGQPGEPGEPGDDEAGGEPGEPGDDEEGEPGEPGEPGDDEEGEPGEPGEPGDDEAGGEPGDDEEGRGVGPEQPDEPEEEPEDIIDRIKNSVRKDMDRDTEQKTEDELTAEEVEDRQSKRDQENAKKKVRSDVGSAVSGVPADSPDMDRLRSLGADRVTTSMTATAGAWQRRLHDLLANAMGIEGDYDPNMPSARIEGEFGREVDVPSIQNVVLSFDCSHSMGPTLFRRALDEINTFIKVAGPRLSDCTFWIVYWGGPNNVIHNRLYNTANLIDRINSGARSLGTTAPYYSFAWMSRRVREPDAIIIFTDGEFNEDPYTFNSQVDTYIRQMRERFVWVLTSDGETAKIRDYYDRGYRQRLVRQR